MRRLLGVLVAVIFFSHAEAENFSDSVNQGLRFEEGLSWKETLTKAKAEHKYVFVDCYTTWCGPCKKMDKEVYPDPKVGEFFNRNFICYRVQLDTSAADNAAVRSRYAEAHEIDKQFKITSYPTYLFFNPDGQLLNRFSGAIPVEQFLVLGNMTIDPAKDYYALLKKFHEGKADLTQISFLAQQSMVLGDTAGSKEISKSYLSKLNKDSLLTKSNIQFMNQFTRSSSDLGFELFYNYPDSINRIMADDTYAQGVVQGVLYDEIITPAVNVANKNNTIPDWEKLAVTIDKKYGTYYSKRLIVAARCTWGSRHKDWQEYTKYLTEFQEDYGTKINQGEGASMGLNNYAWAIFQYSNNKEELRKALGWSGRAILMAPDVPNWMDTYANILYKLGQTNLAIKWEQTALKLDPGNKDTEAVIEKMKKNLPTWPSADQL